MNKRYECTKVEGDECSSLFHPLNMSLLCMFDFHSPIRNSCSKRFELECTAPSNDFRKCTYIHIIPSLQALKWIGPFENCPGVHLPILQPRPLTTERIFYLFARRIVFAIIDSSRYRSVICRCYNARTQRSPMEYSSNVIRFSRVELL